MNDKDADILLVEDNPGDATLIIMAIRKTSPMKKVIWLQDGEKALDFILNDDEIKSRIDGKKNLVVLLDLSLPKISGIEVLKKLRSSPNARNLDITILTGSKKESDLVESYGYGVKTYINKEIANKNCIKVICGEGHEDEIEKILLAGIKSVNEEKKPK
jgi:two-component system, response regulator